MGQPNDEINVGSLLEEMDAVINEAPQENEEINKTKIFEYRGFVGIMAGDKFVNDPTKSDQLGCIVDFDNLEISQEAFDVLIKIKKSANSLGDVMCWGNCFGWVGGPFHIVNFDTTEADKDYQPELLNKCISEIEMPQSFKDHIDKYFEGDPQN